MQMLLCAGAADENIIQVAKSEVQPGQYLFHEALERLTGVAQPKWHPQELQQPERCNHRRLMNVSLLDWYLVVALPEIQLAEDAAPVQPGGEILNVGQRIGIWVCGEVQSAVMAAGPPCPIRLHDHVERCRPVAG